MQDPDQSNNEEQTVLSNNEADVVSEAPEDKAEHVTRSSGLSMVSAYYDYRLDNHRQGETHREDSMGNHWSVPWADLMMVMFVLFAALVSANAAQQKIPDIVEKTVEIETPIESPLEYTTGAQSPVTEPSFEPLMQVNVFEKSQQAVRDTNIENVEIVLMKDQSVKVSVRGPLLFDLGTDRLNPEVKSFLKTLSGVIRQTPYDVNVIGHTDDQPIRNRNFASNWELSLMRAAQVAKHLIDEGQVDPARFTVMGRSEYAPVTPNSSEQNRSLNRRVEIIITRNISSSAETGT